MNFQDQDPRYCAAKRLFDDFTDAWNKGDLERACMNYHANASLIGKSVRICGREAIVKHYRASFQDKPMGNLSFEILEFYPNPGRTPPIESYVLSATVAWKLVSPDGQEESGLSLLVLLDHSSRMWVIQDATP